jgi:eukaryotic-like serine/threonine-protein kinase
MKIDPGIWPSLSALLDEYLEQPEASRPAWLERLGPEYAEVLPILREVVGNGTIGEDTFLDTLPRLRQQDGITGDVLLAPGSLLGPYRLIRQLGRGGMSIVWLAERADGLIKRHVALKLPTIVLQGSTLGERFDRERDILAQLTHPQIARLYDAGITAWGQSYLALEYVEGQRITTHCDRHRLNLKARLELFRDVLGAVDYAHKRGIVHRDLKPSNILVTAGGEIRLLDFGIATLLVEGQAQETELTRAGGHALTPEYASPEQLAGRAVNQTSDVFSLGLVLYELMTGEYSRPTADADPVRPSQVVAKSEAGPARANDRKRLASALKGDLDTIVLHALAQAPEERYPTAGELALDIDRYLTGKPVLARPPARSYRTRKFVQRNRAAVIAAAGVGLALGLTLSLALWESVRAHRAETAAAAGASSPFVVRGRPFAADVRTIAVLPFKNLGGRDQEYFSDGFTDLLTDDLSKIRALRVISRTSTMQYKDRREGFPRIASELGADRLVDGTVRQSGDVLRVDVRLIEASTGAALWSSSYERAMRDLFALQRELAIDISARIRVSVTAADRSRLAPVSQSDPQAQEAYLRGWAHFERYTPDDTQQALHEFEESIRFDPTDARAYAALSHTYWALASTYNLLPRDEAFSKAKSAAQEAIRLDPNLPRAYSALGQIGFYYEWNWREAESAFTRAIELNPSDADAHELFGWYLAARDRIGEAEHEMSTARVLDPRAMGRRSPHAAVLYYGRRYDEAIDELRQMVSLDPSLQASHFRLGRAYAAKRMYREAVAEIDRPATPPAFRLAELARIYADAGQRQMAEESVHALENVLRASGESLRADSLAFVYAALGERDRAFDLLEQAVAERSSGVLWLKVDPRFDPIRGDARFGRILARIGL